MQKHYLHGSSKSRAYLENVGEGFAGEVDYLADGAAYLLAAADGFVLVGGGALEEFSDVGEVKVLLEEGEELGVGDSWLPWLEVQ